MEHYPDKLVPISDGVPKVFLEAGKGEAQILILDEPFNGLDKHMVEKMRQVLNKQKQEGKTILLASHNEKDIAYICDRTYEIDGGRIISGQQL